MNASASSSGSTSSKHVHLQTRHVNEIFEYYLQIDNCLYPPPNVKKRNNNIPIKYTRLPDYTPRGVDVYSEKNLSLQPRLRRIVELEDDKNMKTNRSLGKIETKRPPFSPSSVKRKIVKMTNGNYADLHPNFSKSQKSTVPIKTTCSSPQKVQNCSEIKNLPKSRTSTSISVVKTPTSLRKSVWTKTTRSAITDRPSIKLAKRDNSMVKNVPDKRIVIVNESSQNLENSINTEAKTNVTKIVVIRGTNKIVNKLSNEDIKSKKPEVSHNLRLTKAKYSLVKDVKGRKPVITVPLEKKYNRPTEADALQFKENSSKHKLLKHKKTNVYKTNQSDVSKRKDRDTEYIGTAQKNNIKNVATNTDPLPVTKEDKVSEFENVVQMSQACSNISNEEFFDSLDVPNVSLTKDKKILSKETSLELCSHSLPNIRVPTLKLSHHGVNIANGQQSSFIIGRTMFTCTTSQEIDIHMVDNDNSPQHMYKEMSYPLNVVSVLKREFENVSDTNLPGRYQKANDENSVNNTLHTQTFLYTCDKSILLKPSDIISVHNGISQCDSDCEQFQREINFIDSFIESLQYLESCSSTDKCFDYNEDKKESICSDFNIKPNECDLLVSKSENYGNNDTETMASKSLCLLNLLIRDEQRRAKNLLFVLKMREDALKDFTKSQILWLENKKKQENTDISTLKKKQRGALLKLQHECGEMQRMRKALLALTEKRKLAFMKTKKNLELKLTNNVEPLLLGKKFKRNSNPDRNIAPLKCFDLLSTSGCDDSTYSRSRVETVPPKFSEGVQSAEKSIQTGDSLVESHLVNQSTDTSAEHFVSVDGIFLNILFGNLALPQIFNAGRTYEVNEEALKRIVSSANTSHDPLSVNNNLETLVSQLKPDLDASSTPSTARSLVDELDQYYRGFMEDDNSQAVIIHKEASELPITSELCNVTKDMDVFNFKMGNINSNDCTVVDSFKSNASILSSSDSYMSVMSNEFCSFEGKAQVEIETDSEVKRVTAGPLPVPAGAPLENRPTSAHFDSTIKSSVSTSCAEDSWNSGVISKPASSVAIPVPPGNLEAEELRRQQLAIEKEIKALEQQQCQLLALREIPDKPPPPYTPPNDAGISKASRKFSLDASAIEKIHDSLCRPAAERQIESTDAFELFIKDYCGDTIAKQKAEQSENPWDACLLLPQAVANKPEELINRVIADLKEVLTSVTPTVVSGVGTRRWDHIDDILFAEWRRCEPEWTALRSDEAVAKNQTYENIFQKILAETVREYKAIVLSETKS